MDWIPFHHPDLSLPVVKRRVAEAWIDLMKDVGDMLLTNGRSLIWNCSYPSQTAYRMAMSRLKKEGLVVKYTDETKLPCLKLTDKGLRGLPDYHYPEKFWNTKWNGIWYMLIFDVPEAERHYRDSLRLFLKHLRMGCLQKSVWITPRDIRPEYDNLEQTANIQAVSYLLESKTVLHQDKAEMVQNAWNMDRLIPLHERYLLVIRNNMVLMKNATHSELDLTTLLHLEAEAYVQCMSQDPLLPRALLPSNYLGRKVYELHTEFRKAVSSALLNT
jgi:phenylacetic acid degradation operon negative regulatory protein